MMDISKVHFCRRESNDRTNIFEMFYGSTHFEIIQLFQDDIFGAGNTRLNGFGKGKLTPSSKFFPTKGMTISMSFVSRGSPYIIAPTEPQIMYSICNDSNI